MVARDLHLITHRLHDQRQKLATNAELRRNYLTSVYHAQIKGEKQAIAAHIGRLQPGARRAYLKHRMGVLDARAKMTPVGLV
jgi:hypothetical protein